MNELLHPKLDERLRKHLGTVDLDPFSRIASSRIAKSAIPNIGLVELVSADVFDQLYNELYIAMFHGGERERSDLIVERLEHDFAGKRIGLQPYRIVGLRDHAGRAIGAAQFSVLMLSGGSIAVPYIQYIYVRPENRRQDLSELLHTLVLAVSIADARSERRSVPFALFETEPPCHGDDDAHRSKAELRSQIHTKSGSTAMLLRRKDDNRLISAHVQPGLEPEDGPLTLVWMLRPSPAAQATIDIEAVGAQLIAAYYQSLRDEGFPEKNIALAESIVASRSRRSEFCTIPLAQVTKDMYVNIDGNDSS